MASSSGVPPLSPSRAGTALRHSPTPQSNFTINFFDPKKPIGFLKGSLPHWRQDGTSYFLTFRLADSLPQEKLSQWKSEKAAWLLSNPEPHAPEQRLEYHTRFTKRMNTWLDANYGSCILKNPEISIIVNSALTHFNRNRYLLDQYVVASNHVHVILTPYSHHSLSKIVHSWKSFTAHQINKALQIPDKVPSQKSGHIWQKETFDHIIRSPESLEKFREYIKAHTRH